MSKARVVVLEVVSGNLTVTAAARAYGLSRQHIYRLLNRYQLGGLEAVDPRSRRPGSNPRAVGSGSVSSALGIFASGKVTVDSYKKDVEGLLVFNRGEVVKLHGGAGVGLSVSMRYLVVPAEAGRGPWKVSTIGYMYELHLNDHALYEYHWHPISTSHEIRPHLHCSAVERKHIPTGRVMIEDVLNLAVQHGARPNSMTRWRELDGLNREKFARGATWGVGPS